MIAWKIIINSARGAKNISPWNVLVNLLEQKLEDILTARSAAKSRKRNGRPITRSISHERRKSIIKANMENGFFELTISAIAKKSKEKTTNIEGRSPLK